VRALFRLAVELVPEYAVVVLLVGGLSGWASQFDSFTARLGLLGVLLVTLPALSLPSLVMVARALSPGVAAFAVVAVACGGLAAGGALTVLA
jgi:hypothetical protein